MWSYMSPNVLTETRCQVDTVNTKMKQIAIFMRVFSDFRCGDQFEEHAALFYIAEMTQAIHTLHTMGYVHRYVQCFHPLTRIP